MKNIFFKERKYIVCFFLFYLFIYGMIVFSSFLNNDDVARTFTGYYSWFYDGRTISDFLIKIFIGSNGVINVGPLFKILALVCMSLSSVVLLKVYNMPRNFFGMLFISIGYSFPSILENLSHIYDSFPMMFSVFCSTLALYFIAQKNKLSWLLCIVFILLGLNSYQVSANVFLVLLFCLLIVKIIAKENEKYFLLKGGVCLFISLLFYKILVAKYYVFNEYSSSKSGSLGISDLYLLKSNLYEFYRLMGSFCFYRQEFLFSTVSIFVLPCFSVLISKMSFFSKVKIYIYYFLSFLSIAGVLMLLKYPVIAPRTLLAVGIFFSCSLIILSKSASYKLDYIAVVPSGLIMICILSLSYALGSYTNNIQNDMRVTYPKIASLLNKNTSKGDIVYIIGEPYLPQSIISNSKLNKVIRKIVHQPMIWGNIWGHTAMIQYGFNDKATYSLNHSYSDVMPRLEKLYPEECYPDLKLKIYRENRSVYFVFE